MKRVFNVGDVVYHPKYGKGVVKNVDSAVRSEDPYFVEWMVTYYPGWFAESMLSFEPWPKPVHVKPFAKGWYVFLENNHYLVKYLSEFPEEEDVTLIHYFGARMPEGIK